jgi:Leucine-rich repeat (LRR) protein
MKIIPSSRRHHYVARVGVFLVTLVLLAGMVGCNGGGVEQEAVTFTDLNLEAAVREAIAIPEGSIYSSDLDSLISLEANEKNIADLTGLECCTSLTVLDLGDNQISDISPLGNLTSLMGLYLEYNQIGDISPLANLTNLENLHLWDNQISDISPLANLTNLEYLYLWNNQISDISPLADLTSLMALDLDYNQISDISPLVDNEGLSEGDEVNLTGNPLSQQSINEYIPQLEAREVIVDY